MLYPFETNLYDMKKKTQSVERYISKKKQWERNILVPRASILLTSPMDSQIYEAPQKIRSIVICGFQLWSHLELLSMALAKRMRMRKRAEKIDTIVGEKIIYFCKNMRYTVYAELKS